jgi:prephenate dehydrogenase
MTTASNLTVGVIGLGLIGGSFAKAYKNNGHMVLACDTDESIQEFAVLSGAADGILDDGNLGKCDLVLIALYPTAAIEFLEKSAGFIKARATVIDCCGTKKNICSSGFAAAEKYAFTFVGGHPMAGKEQSGFKHSDPEMFKGEIMVIVPPEEHANDIEFLEKIKALLQPAGFKRLTVTTAQNHDKMIAFTSQMAHLVSNAFVKSPTVREHKGFSAGSYKDLTRVAWLNEQMWAELFMENREYLLGELDLFITSLQQYKDAMHNEDFGRLRGLLYDGKILKEEVDRS